MKVFDDKVWNQKSRSLGRTEMKKLIIVSSIFVAKKITEERYSYREYGRLKSIILHLKRPIERKNKYGSRMIDEFSINFTKNRYRENEPRFICVNRIPVLK